MDYRNGFVNPVPIHILVEEIDVVLIEQVIAQVITEENIQVQGQGQLLEFGQGGTSLLAPR